jgi:hypothetical protein
VERFHRPLTQERWPRARRDRLDPCPQDLSHWRPEVYHLVRPPESLGDYPPVQRWRPSPRPRPGQLPEVTYPVEAVVRKVRNRGAIAWHGYRILVGAGREGEDVRREERDHDVAVFSAGKELRCLPLAPLTKDRILEAAWPARGGPGRAGPGRLQQGGLVKRSRALRGRNPTRDNQADGAPRVHRAPDHRGGRGPPLVPPSDTGVMPPKSTFILSQTRSSAHGPRPPP